MLLIPFAILVVLGILNYSFFNGKKSLRYRNWYRPWLVLLLAIIALIFETKAEAKISSIPLVVGSALAGVKYAAELGFAISFYYIWFQLKTFMHAFKLDDFVEKQLKKHNTNELLAQKRGFANYLVWPYFINGFSIYNKPGFKFFKYLLYFSLLFVTLGYFWSVYKYGQTPFVIPTGLGALLALVLIEWILYFNCLVAKSPDYYDSDNEIGKEVNFYNLFKRYSNREKGFYDSIIFGHIKNNHIKAAELEKNTKQYIDVFVQEFKDDNKDFIVSSNDFIKSIPQFAEVFFDTLKKGGNILILADIPNHTKFKPKDVGINYDHNDDLESIAKMFSVYMEQTFEKKVPSAQSLMDIGYYDKKERSGLTKRIIMSSIQDAIDAPLIHSNWMKELDLVVVMQFSDAYANNLLLKRQLSLWLEQQKISYKTVLFKVFRTSGDEALTNTWMTIRNPSEVKLENIATARKQYYINYAFEKTPSNLKKIFKGDGHQYDYSPGIELSVMAIMENVKHIHYFEGYHLDYIQSKNKLATAQTAFYRYDNDRDNPYNYGEKVTQHKIESAIQANNLPFIVRPLDSPLYCEEKHLSVIYDIENNAPKMYQKYQHLGKDESFVCIISKPHLFRAFFAEQLSYFVDVTLEALEPQLSKANINLCLQLFHLMKHEKIEINYIRHLLNLHSVSLTDKTVVEFINELFKRYLHLDSRANSILKSESSIDFVAGKYIEVQKLSIDNQDVNANDIFDYMEDVKVVDHNRNILLTIPKYLLFQNILPQQNIIINGSSFQYNNYNQRNRELVLEAIATNIQTFYKPVALIKHFDTPVTPIDVKKVINFNVNKKDYQFSSEILEREMEVRYSKYFSFDSSYHSPFAKENSPQFIDLEANTSFQDNSKRKYITRYLKLQWDLSDAFLNGKAVLNTRFHHLLYEFMPILFPYRHQYIQVLSDNALDKKHREATPWIFPEHNFKTENKNSIEIYIVEDSFSDLGILKSVQNHLKFIMEHLYDLMRWMRDDVNCHTADYMEYVKGQSFYEDRTQFLKYGLSDKEISWDIDLLARFIKENSFFSSDDIDTNYDQRCTGENQSINVICDYCKGDFKLTDIHVMEDGLHRCHDCSIDAIDSENQVKELEKEAFELYKKHLGIVIDKKSLPYKMNFVTATALHEYYGKDFYITNDFDKRTAVGLASDRDIDAIHIEKSLSKAATLSIIIHEMMHIMQYQKLNYFKLKNREPELIEGMTTWAEHYILSKSTVPEYKAYAKNYHAQLTEDQTIYGKGYRYVINKYGDDSETMERIFRKYGG